MEWAGKAVAATALSLAQAGLDHESPVRAKAAWRFASRHDAAELAIRVESLEASRTRNILYAPLRGGAQRAVDGASTAAPEARALRTTGFIGYSFI